MRPKKVSSKTIIDAFYKHKVLNKKKILQSAGCSSMTAWRILSQHGYITSYNFNSAYYTLSNIPQFDKNGLWSYRKIRFSKYGSLTDTVIALVRNSASGLDSNALKELLVVNPSPILTKLHAKENIKRKKIGTVFVYFHTEKLREEIQLSNRQKKIERDFVRMKLPEPERIIVVLLELIQRVELKPRQVARRLSNKGIKITTMEIQAIFAHYKLTHPKKNWIF